MGVAAFVKVRLVITGRSGYYQVVLRRDVGCEIRVRACKHKGPTC